jgi:hypothetical protein
MNGEVFPAMQRLIVALEQARTVMLEVKNIIQEAEEEAASLFRNGGAGVGAHSATNLLSDSLDTTHLAHIQITPREPKKLSERAIKAVRMLYSLPLSQRVAYVRRLRQEQPATHQSIVTAIREGMPLREIMGPIAIDMAAASPWGRTKEGKTAMAHLAKMYAHNQVQFDKLPLGHAITKPENEDKSKNGIGSPSTITLSESDLSNTPEGLAAVVAHEAVHAYRMAKGIEKLSVLDSETDAGIAEAKVWASFGQDKYNSASPTIYEIDETSQQFSPANPNDVSKMRTHVATEYAYSFAGTGDPGNLKQGAAMIDNLLSGGDASQIVKSASDMQIKKIAKAYNDFLPHADRRNIATTERNWKLLSDEMDARKLWSK